MKSKDNVTAPDPQQTNCLCLEFKVTGWIEIENREGMVASAEDSENKPIGETYYIISAEQKMKMQCPLLKKKPKRINVSVKVIKYKTCSFLCGFFLDLLCCFCLLFNDTLTCHGNTHPEKADPCRSPGTPPARVCRPPLRGHLPKAT